MIFSPVANLMHHPLVWLLAAWFTFTIIDGDPKVGILENNCCNKKISIMETITKHKETVPNEKFGLKGLNYWWL